MVKNRATTPANFHELTIDEQWLLRRISAFVSNQYIHLFDIGGNRVWDGTHFRAFVFPHDDLKDRFKDELAKFGVSYVKNISKLPSSPIGATAAITAFCVSATLNGRDVKTHLKKYIHYIRNGDYELKAFKDNEKAADIIEILLEKEFNENVTPPIEKLSGESKSLGGESKNDEKPQNGVPSAISSNKNPIGLDISWKGDKFIRIKEGKGTDLLWIDDLEDKLDCRKESHLLSWKYHFTPFMGRVEDLARLEQWANTEEQLKVQLLHGVGGTGKTRLAFQFAKRMRGQGWQAGQTDLDFEGDWRVGKKGILIIVDDSEEKRNYIEELSRALSNCQAKTIIIRVLVIGRHLEFLKLITARIEDFVAKDSLQLQGFKPNEHPRRLFEIAWQSLTNLREGRDKNDTIKAKPALSTLQFDEWLAEEPEHTTPLMIVALGIYCADNPGTLLPNITKVQAPVLLQHLCAREYEKIRQEIKLFNAEPSCQKKLDFHVITRLTGVAAIAGGMNTKKIRSMVTWLEDTNYQRPAIELLKETSLWDHRENQLPSIKPDIFAAGFLVHVLHKFDDLEAAYWLLGATGLPKTVEQDVCTTTVKSNFKRLGRLITDATYRLRMPFPRKLFKIAIQDQTALRTWLVKHIVKDYLDPCFIELSMNVLQTSLKNEKNEIQKARMLSVLAYLHVEIGENVRGVNAARESIAIFKKMRQKATEEINVYIAIDLYITGSLFSNENYAKSSGDTDFRINPSFGSHFLAAGSKLAEDIYTYGVYLGGPKLWTDSFTYIYKSVNVFASLRDEGYEMSSGLMARALRFIALLLEQWFLVPPNNDVDIRAELRKLKRYSETLLSFSKVDKTKRSNVSCVLLYKGNPTNPTQVNIYEAFADEITATQQELSLDCTKLAGFFFKCEVNDASKTKQKNRIK